MVKLKITRLIYPRNETNYYEYSSIDNLLKDLKFMLEKHYISSEDIIRIEI
jgi:hypothetical protein